MHSVSRIMIKEQHPLYSYCMETTAASKRLYNAALFRIRNRFTGYRKIALTEHELQVLEELDTLWKSGIHTGKIKFVLSYGRLEKLMRVTDNPDFFCPSLSKQIAQYHISQRQLAKVSGITEVSISRYIKGERSPKTEELIKIANCLQTSTDFLLGIEPRKEAVEDLIIKLDVLSNDTTLPLNECLEYHKAKLIIRKICKR